MNQDKIEKLVWEVDAWASKNFPIRLPRIGVLEEVGELAHCFLKNIQKIRGYGDDAFFKEKAGDAIADIAIYVFNDMAIAQCASACILKEADPFDYTDTDELQERLGLLAEEAAMLLGTIEDDGICQTKILSMIRDFADALDLDFEKIVDETWAKVSQRDWTKNPDNADQVGIQG